MMRIKILLVFTLFLLGAEMVSAQNFVTRWDLGKTGSAGNKSISFIATVTGTGAKYTWKTSDGQQSGGSTISARASGAVTITGLPTNKMIDLFIEPTNLKRFAMNNGTDKARLLDIKQWGKANWNSMLNAFYGASNLTISATDVPNLAGVSSMRGMFWGCATLDGPSNIGDWNTGAVTDMGNVFYDAAVFNRAIGGWNTAKVNYMGFMFYGAKAFNQPLNNWNTGAVTNMLNMFGYAKAFNQPLANWNTAKVTDMNGMFSGAYSFNQDLSTWALNAGVNLTNFLNNTGLSCYNYSKMLVTWASRSVTGRTLGATNIKYGTNAAAARATLTKSVATGGKGWIITDGGASGSDCSVSTDGFVTRWDLGKTGSAGNNSIFFTVTVTGAPAYYTWNTVPAGTTQSGVLPVGTNNIVSIPNLPANKMIELVIEPTNLKQFAMINGIDKARLVEIKQWGKTNWSSMLNAFYGASNLTVSATDIPNLAGVSNMQGMFRECAALNGPTNIGDWNTGTVTDMSFLFNGAIVFNQPVNNWNTAKVTDMGSMFSGAKVFNRPLTNWNTANVTKMVGLFAGATVFNQPLTSWNTAKVTNMGYMFQDAVAFNGAVGSWNTDNVTDMTGMFSRAIAFNQPLNNWNTASVTHMGSMFADASAFNGAVGTWNTAKVTHMGSMFNGAKAFNQPLANWNTAAVTDMVGMFQDAKAFNQPLTNWNTAKVFYMTSMFSGASSFDQDLSTWQWNRYVDFDRFLNNTGLSCKNYSKMLITWANGTLTGRTFGAANRTYGTNAASARAMLAKSVATGGKGWTITDGGSSGANCSVPTDGFVTRWDLGKTGTAGNNSVSFTATVTGFPAHYTWSIVPSGTAQSGPITIGIQSGTLPVGTNIVVSIPNLPANKMIELFIEPSNLKQFAMNNGTDKSRLVEIRQWGTANWSSMLNAFYGASNLTVSATDVPNLAGVTNMQGMFRGCSILDSVANIGAWNTANVTDMSYLFNDATVFNQPLGTWNTGAVTNMQSMFFGANAFDQSLGHFNTITVTDMSYVFANAKAFNQPLNTWNTGAVTTMRSMFQNASAFNKAVGTWNTAKVTNMQSLFAGATVFNQPLGTWNTGAVTNMQSMFSGANAFDQSLGHFNTAKVTDMGYVFRDATVFNQPLTNWNTAAVTNMESMFQNASAFNGAVGTWNTANVTNMKSIFSGAIVFNRPLTNWTTAKVTNMGQVFLNAAAFDQPLTTWNTAKVTNMQGLFAGATAFNQPLATWNTGAVTDMGDMFAGATAFNQPLAKWNTAKVTKMQGLFADATAFNQPLDTWNTGVVTDMGYMFENASAFNGAVHTWNTANVTNMKGMFSGATAFNQKLSAWTLNAGVDLANFLDNTGLSCKNYSDMLTTWAVRNVRGRTLGAANIRYGTNATAARAALTGKGWTITDGGTSGSDCNFPENLFVTKWDLSRNGTKNAISFYTTVTGPGANCTWKTLDGTKSGSGTIKPNELAIINGLPANATIELFIEPTNLTRFAIANGGDKERLMEVEQWGTAKWQTMAYAYAGASNVTVTATDIPNLANVTSMESMFENCAKLDGPDNIGLWNTAKVTNMKSVFSGAKAFSQSLTNWITSAVIDMRNMLYGAIAFNQNLSTWKWNKDVVLDGVFSNSGLSCNNYSDVLKALNNSSITNHTLGAEGVAYGIGAGEDRAALINKGWKITDAGPTATDCGKKYPANLFITKWDLGKIGTTGNTVISFAAETKGGLARYTWTASNGQKGEGTIRGTNGWAAITGLPANSVIELAIEPANLKRFAINNGINKLRLVDVLQWGTSNWNTMEGAFYGASNLKVSATDSPNLTEVGTMENMFRDCSVLDGLANIGLWNTSNVTNMEGLFRDAKVFNQPINWDIAKVTNVKYMFSGAKAFNQDLSALSWNHTVNLTGFLNYCGFSCKNTKKLVNTFEKRPVRDPNFGLPKLFDFKSIEARDWLSNMRIDYEATTVDCDNEPYANHFVTEWDLSKAGANPTSISFFARVSVLTRYTWVSGGTRTEGFILPSQNTQHITIDGLPPNATIELFIASPNLKRFAIASGGDAARLVDVVQWGTSEWETMAFAFQGASNLNISAADVPDLTRVGSMRAMFHGCRILNEPNNIGLWNTSNVTDMSGMFSEAASFNRPLNSWNTAKVTDMSDMFSGAASFNQNLDGWITKKVTDMTAMFQNASAFNGAVGTWNTGKVTSMRSMFAGATVFNGDISWQTGNVINVTDMKGMFANATAFNQSLNKWITEKVTDMSGMFFEARAFNQSLDKWNTEKVTDMSSMFFEARAFNQDLSAWTLNANVSLDKFLNGTSLSCDNYSNMLNAWANRNVTGRTLGAEGVRYGTNAVEARYKLTKAIVNGGKGWIINDKGPYTWCPNPADFATKWSSNANGSISFRATVTGSGASYIWTNSNRSRTGSGIIPPKNNELVTIDNLPAGDVTLFIESTNLKQFRIANGPDKNLLKNVSQWGAAQWTSMEDAFYGASNLTIIATDVPMLSGVKSMGGMFEDCVSLTTIPNVNLWQTANVTNMKSMFSNAEKFDQDLSTWYFNSDVNLESFLDYSGLSCYNYSRMLISWEDWYHIQRRNLGARGLKYGTNAAEARAKLTVKGTWSNIAWTITGDAPSGSDCSANPLGPVNKGTVNNYSDPSKVVIDNRLTAVAEVDKLSSQATVVLYPNPVSGNINLLFSNYEGASAKVFITNILGQSVYQETLRINAGQNDYRLNLIKPLATGQYVLRVEGKDLTQVIKLVAK